MTIKRSNPKNGEYFVDSINNVNSGSKDITVNKDGFAFVEGVGFDPLIDGRKKYAGYVGYKDKSLYCFVLDDHHHPFRRRERPLCGRHRPGSG